MATIDNNVINQLIDIFNSVEKTALLGKGDGWLNLAKYGPAIKSAGIDYNKLGFPKLKEFVVASGVFELVADESNYPPVIFIKEKNTKPNAEVTNRDLKKQAVSEKETTTYNKWTTKLLEEWKLPEPVAVGFLQIFPDGHYQISDFRTESFRELKYPEWEDATDELNRTIFIIDNRPISNPYKSDKYFKFRWTAIDYDNERGYKIVLEQPILFENINPQKLIQSIHDIWNNPDAAEQMKNVMNMVSVELTASSDGTFIFELLQNANDNAATDKERKVEPVDVEFHITENYLICRHSGDYFSPRDISGVCKLGDGTKKMRKSAIGYKGIGFKTVFHSHNWVYIQSKDYSFAFSENKNRPWQIMPIWEEPNHLDAEIRNVIEKNSKKFRVVTVMKPRDKKLLRELEDKNYKYLLSDIFKDVRNIIFIPNINSVKVFDNDNNVVDCQYNDNCSWIRSDLSPYDLSDIQEDINKEIILHPERGIPPKYNNFGDTRVAFACICNGDKLEPVTDATVNCYLPTKAEFGFPFLMNTDMVPTGARDQLKPDVEFNAQFAYIAGIKFVEWIKSLLEQDYDANSIFELIPDFENCKNGVGKGYSHFIERFETGFYETCENEEIVPTLSASGEYGLSKLSEVRIDDTGLSKIIGYDTFYKVFGTGKSLPTDKIDSSILNDKFPKKIKELKFEDIIDAVTSDNDFNEWFIYANEEQKEKLYDWLKEKITTTRTNAIISFVSSLPLSQLAFADRKTLFLALKEFLDIDRLKGIALFKNMNGALRPLEKMAPHRDGVETWLKPYIICEEECFDELSAYLISEYRFIKDVVFEHLNEYDGSLSDLKDKYNWTDEDYTKKLIYRYHNDFEKYKEILPIAKKSSKEIQEYYLLWIKVDLSKDKSYNANSFEYQVMQLALSVYENENPSEFTSKIFYDNKCLKEYTIKPEVKQEYSSSSGKKTLILKLSEILPEYQNQTNPTDEIEKLFEPRIKLDKFFVAKSKSQFDIFKELKQIACCEANYEAVRYNGIQRVRELLWNNPGPNASQYLFGCSWATALKEIASYKVDDVFAQELMQILFDNKVEIKSASFISYIYDNYLKNKYFKCNYILDEEQLMPAIEQWAANDEKKREYLLKNGVKNESSPAIQFRKLFLDNKPVDFLDNLSDEEIESGIKYIATADNLMRPFEGENQKKTLLSAKKNCKILSVEWDVDRIKSNAKEWETSEYDNWKDGHTLHIFTYPGKLPSQLLYEEKILLNYENSHIHYYYDKEEQQLFVSDSDIYNVLLFEVVKEAKTPFELNDYEMLKGEMYNVSKEEYATFEKYKEHKKEFEEYLKQIENKEKPNPPTKPDDENGTSDMPPQNPIVTGSGQSIGTGNVPKQDRAQINLEARKKAKEYLENKEGYDCSEWDAENSKQIVKDVKLNGEPIVVVVISSDAGRLHLHPYAFAELMENPNSLILNYRDKQIQSLSFEDIFKNNQSVNLIFDTDIISPKEFAFIANRYRASKKTCFVVENPHYSYSDELKGFGLHETKDEKVKVDFGTEDIFNIFNL